eukprot:scaffold1218_cov393-Prasinococcus_capsulatus_cf.AAC.5
MWSLPRICAMFWSSARPTRIVTASARMLSATDGGLRYWRRERRIFIPPCSRITSNAALRLAFLLCSSEAGTAAPDDGCLAPSAVA